ncbi:hypothetical protein KI387_043903 [Taxus chinensis]|uniref:Uncharacterized protein n=1 Tax=Taxus chinensis TaxID=29808 RepID=A0AA38LK27_TAXCH|nr:hypothetical protein KI387_043903 [Taxus chinensis]
MANWKDFNMGFMKEMFTNMVKQQETTNLYLSQLTQNLNQSRSWDNQEKCENNNKRHPIQVIDEDSCWKKYQSLRKGFRDNMPFPDYCMMKIGSKPKRGHHMPVPELQKNSFEEEEAYREKCMISIEKNNCINKTLLVREIIPAQEKKFVYASKEDVMETLKRCEEWNSRARAAKLIAAQARQHLQEFKENMSSLSGQQGMRNVISQERAAGSMEIHFKGGLITQIKDGVEESMPSHLLQQLIYEEFQPIVDTNTQILGQQSQDILKTKIGEDVGDIPRYKEHTNVSYLLLPIYFHHEMHAKVCIMEFDEPLLQVYVCEHPVDNIWWQVLVHLTRTGARLADHFSMFCLLCMTLGQNNIRIA